VQPVQDDAASISGASRVSAVGGRTVKVSLWIHRELTRGISADTARPKTQKHRLGPSAARCGRRGELEDRPNAAITASIRRPIEIA